MEKRMLGKNGLKVSAIGLGCMRMSFGQAPLPDRKEMIALIRKAVELGVTFLILLRSMDHILTRKLVGEALEPFKGKVVIATKFGSVNLKILLRNYIRLEISMNGGDR